MKPQTNKQRKFKLVTRYQHRHSDGLVSRRKATR